MLGTPQFRVFSIPICAPKPEDLAVVKNPWSIASYVMEAI